MFLKRCLVTFAAVAALNLHAKAQAGSFCEAVNTILQSAPDGFKSITGRMMESNMNASMWASTVKIPGTIGYRIVQSMGLFYEGAVIQTTDKDKLPAVYEEYKKKLADCLIPQGYKLSYQPNVVAGISDLKKVVFMKETEYKEGADLKDLPPHVTMEVTYSKDAGGFTIVMFIFQH